ncbi:helix-turn-helix domain-containing protein [Paenibacillus sp. JJ-223]|uniref:helix-turn-helix domain-containing protein n=1 Tax=Paenibacillus sp. JJ-223 TaxID=2905647 RepID=UPI001F380A67|nr:helix-turn-helix domain-containing protein [Paenibacillus sp. JJ-223]CAH1198733.1 HTH-type transcriptional activator RhaR [Paenibacillus sp. JJ-223]
MPLSFLKWLKFNLTNTQTRLLLILTIAVFAIIIAVGMTTYYSSKSVLQQELSEPQHQMLRIGMNDIDEMMRESDQIAVKIALNGNVYQFLTSDVQASYQNITELLKFMETLISSTSFIKSAYIYDVERGSMVAFPQGFSSSKANFPDSGWVDVADDFKDRPMLVKQREIPSASGPPARQITLYRKIMISGQFKGIIAVNFKSEQMFRHMLQSSVSRLDSRRLILDVDHQPLYELGNYRVGAEVVDQVLSQLDGEKIGEFEHEGKTLLASQIVSPYTGWRYLSVISQDSLLASAQKIRNTVFVVSLLALAAGAAAIAFYNASAFRPVKRMRQLLSGYDRVRMDTGTIDLEKITSQLLTDHAQQAMNLRQTLPEASSKFLMDIHAGHMSGTRELSEKWERYFREWDPAPLIIAMLSIDDYEAWCKRFNKPDHSLLKFAIANIAAELLSGQWRVLTADLGRDRMMVMLQPLGRFSDGDAVTAIGETLPMIRRLLKFQVSAGVSANHDGYMHLQKAMQEAELALDYRLYRGYEQAIPFREVAAAPLDDGVSEDQETMAPLTESIEAGHAEAALHVLDKMLSRLQQENTHPSRAMACLRSVAETLETLRLSRAAECRDLELSSLRTMHLEDVQALLKEQVEAMCAWFGGMLLSKDFVLCQQMIAFMNDHLEEPIGIQDIAEHAGIGTSLASQLFKQEMNETIHGYFTKLRMERACRLLVDTDYKISEIASMVGYQHENSFIRVYRKTKDITPGKYREMMRTRRDSLLEP